MSYFGFLSYFGNFSDLRMVHQHHFGTFLESSGVFRYLSSFFFVKKQGPVFSAGLEYWTSVDSINNFSLLGKLCDLFMALCEAQTNALQLVSSDQALVHIDHLNFNMAVDTPKVTTLTKAPWFLFFFFGLFKKEQFLN